MALAPVLDLRQAPSCGPPSSLEAEQALLGAALYDVEVFHLAADLSPDAFVEPFHARLWEQVARRASAGLGVDPTLLSPAFAADAAFRELGGVRYLADLVDRAPPPRRAADYAAVIADLAARRALIDVGAEIAADAADTSAGAALDVLASAELRLAQIAASGASRAAWRSAATVIADAIDAAQAATLEPTFPSGLAELDAMTGGFAPGELAVIAGRPGMGKSIAGLTIVKANARVGRGTLLVSLEMSGSALGLRLACDLAYDPEAVSYGGFGENPTYDRARRNALSPDQWRKLRGAQQLAAKWPLLIDDRPGLTVAQIEACARRAFREWARRGIEPGPVVVDHMGIVRPEKGRGGNKVQETGDVSRGLAEMAKRLGVPVIALCQINRASEGREDRRPTLAELRWSGAIEEDARLVMFLHRPAYFLRPPEDPASETMAQRVEREAKLADVRHKLLWIVAKQNSGPLGQIESFVDLGCSAIRDRAGLQ